MEIPKWNNIMKSFQNLIAWDKGMTEVLVTKRFSKLGFKPIEKISRREEKYLVHILRKRYREILDGEKGQAIEGNSLIDDVLQSYI